MTDDTTKTDARTLSPQEYKAAVSELLREAGKAESDAEKARIQREVEARFKKESK